VPTFLRPPLFCFLVLPVIALAAPAPTTDNKAKPVASSPAVPAVLDVVTLAVHADDENHKLIVTSAPTLTRVDVPGEAYSLIYNPQTELYTGLEQSNYTYWEFSWPEIRAAVENSKRYESRLQELNLAGINTDPTATPAPATNNTPADAVSAIVPDTSGYVWHQTPEHKNVAGLDCVHWIGENVSGDSVQAWCFNGPLPKLQSAVDRLRTVNEPMALVALRSLVPPFVFPVYDALVKGGMTPVLILWGGDQKKNSFAFVEAKTRPTKADLFAVPKLYMKTTLVSMDGLIDQKK
jgi:hypothetical protein